MPRTPAHQDRFDDLPLDGGRIGAHRAENPRMRGGVVVLWSVIAIVVLVAVGIFGTLVATGRVTLFPTPSATPTPIATAEPVVDTSFKVTVLNATTQSGLAGALAQTIVAAGWAADDVTAGDAGSTGFQTTTVFYSDPAEEGAARGLAQVIGGATVSLSDAYAGLAGGDGSTLLVVVIGADRTDAGATPAG
ncbi:MULTISPECIES: LytR C-terminal domain-containing protein [Microbacterium]|uniref:LytR C-terminal domain-containing protein n=1 Tax=Microbacterium TaxID=33882 RepID=UPI00168BA105|nr:MULTISPECIES: LytR C-terminal domain-containing protein [Microbacterium]QOC24889.1 LytR C-terminal domain-containing protein [Microbacterium hominis]QYF98857.1 LytR C-terminal domain-containing protein [Microbacterium sp. PAMC21962]